MCIVLGKLADGMQRPAKDEQAWMLVGANNNAQGAFPLDREHFGLPGSMYLWRLLVAGVEEVEVAALKGNRGLLGWPALSSHQAQPHVVILSSPTPEVDPKAIHSFHLLTSEYHNASKELLHAIPESCQQMCLRNINPQGYSSCITALQESSPADINGYMIAPARYIHTLLAVPALSSISKSFSPTGLRREVSHDGSIQAESWATRS